MRKIVAFFLMLSMACILLTGCQSEADKQRQKAKEMNDRVLSGEGLK